MKNVMRGWHAVLERGLSDPNATIKLPGALNRGSARCLEQIAKIRNGSLLYSVGK